MKQPRNIQSWPTPEIFIRRGWTLRLWQDVSAVVVVPVSLAYRLLVQPSSISPQETGSISAAPTSLVYGNNVVFHSSVTPSEVGSISATPNSLSYQLVVFHSTATANEISRLTIIPTTLTYKLVVVPSSASPADQGSISVIPTSLLYH